MVARAMTPFYALVRLIHFTSGDVSTMPVTFCKTLAEAESAKESALVQLRRAYALPGRKQLLEMIGIGAISFEIGEYKTAHENLVEVPRLIMPH